MALHLSVLLLFAAVTGIHSIIQTVTKVSVKAGRSISVPCRYESQHTHHVKYLCRGSEFKNCSTEVKTNQQNSSGKFSISDDKHQRIFTVTFNNLPVGDSHYWCAVEMNDGPDIAVRFQLSVTTGSPQLSVDHQEITGFNGDYVTIHFESNISGEIQWCRLGGSCVNVSGSINGTRVTINANVADFTVTLSGLRTESSGWYLCNKGGLQMPVHVTVKERIHSIIQTVTKVSVKAGRSISVPCRYESQHTHHVKYVCRGSEFKSCSTEVKTNQQNSSGKFSISDDKHQRIFTVTFNNLSVGDSHYWCAVEINDGPGIAVRFQLSVTTGSPQLSVDHQEITGFNGDYVTIHFESNISGEIQWCRLGGACVNEMSGSIDGTRVTINANVADFTVTLSGLRTESSGWYLCTKGGLQMPVHVTVKEMNHTAVSAYEENHRSVDFTFTYSIQRTMDNLNQFS
ncbi:Polymeric immunoglobulin receptor [Nibea albiflora]|nr:Polymeric immunoglobulin receptor [Nibea albiflora]